MKTLSWLPPAVAPWAALGLAACLLCSCATTQRAKIEPWIKDGQKAGTIHISQIPPPNSFHLGAAYYYEYQDLSGRRVQIEARDNNRQLCPGACVLHFDSDAAGLPQAARYFDASGKPALGPWGWACCSWNRSTDADARLVVVESYFDCEGRPATIQGGFAVSRQTYDADGKLRDLKFLDGSAKPAAAHWMGANRVAEVQYSYLEGVGEVTCVAILDAAGNVLERRQLNGATAASWSQTTTTSSYGSPTYHSAGGHTFTPSAAPAAVRQTPKSPPQ